jgi:cardiolipin synthase
LPGHFFLVTLPAVTSDNPAYCFLNGHRARWLPDGDSTFAAMLELLASARESICLESYIVRPGEPADSLRRELLAARARGVHVRVLYDAFGSEGLPDTVFGPLAAAGGEVRVFSPAPRLRLAFRDHRKLLVCDDVRAIVGGHNIAPEYAGDGVTRGWRDLALQIDGPIGAELAATFHAMFALAPMNGTAIRDFRARVRLRKRKESAGTVRLLTSGPGWPAGELSRALRFDLHSARDVRCMAGYFLPPSRIRRALHRCADRGGAVQLLLAGRSDVPIARYAAEYLYGGLLAGGARIYEYQPQILHAKLILMDDTVYVGSCNLDRRSLSINYELLLRLEWPELAALGRGLFQDSLVHSRAVSATTWHNGRRWWERLRSQAAYWLLARVDPLLARRGLRSLS